MSGFTLHKLFQTTLLLSLGLAPLLGGAEEMALEMSPPPSEPYLGPAKQVEPGFVPPKEADGVRPLSAFRSATFPATGDFNLGYLDSRHQSRAFYNSVFLASEDTPIGWTGDTPTCVAGDTSQEFKEAVLIRINWYRAMAGLPDAVTFNTGAGSFSDKAQDAALMMSRNNALSHYPPNTWYCYTADGYEAAGHSNISLGHNGWNAVSGQMRDWGASNYIAGHRRWLLYPQSDLMGTGDVPVDGSYDEANDIWVMDGYGDSRPSVRDDYVAWPPPGYVPYQAVYARWSLSYPGANFSNATVTMLKDQAEFVSAVKETVTNGYGENTIVWQAEGHDPNDYFDTWPAPGADTTYNVIIQGVTGSGVPTSFVYNVVVFDPSVAGVGEVVPEVSGSSSITTAGAAYTHTTVGFGQGYELRELGMESYSGTEGAEDGGANIIDGTSVDYDLVTNQTKATGAYSFHLAHPTATDQYFEIDRTYVLGGSSELQFKTRLGWANAGQVARAQISLDDGTSWSDLWSQAGTGGSGDATFTTRSSSLAAYAARTARFRFLYDYVSGGYFNQVDAGVGLYVDDITVTNTQRVTGETLFALGNTGSFNYTPSGAGTFGLQVHAVPWSGFEGLDWGEIFTVTVAAGNNCNGTAVTVNWSFDPAETTTCTATTSLATSGTVTVPSTADIEFISPIIDLLPGFSVQSGGLFHGHQ